MNIAAAQPVTPTMAAARHGLDDRLAGVLLVLLALVPLPLGANRPVFWALFTLLLGLAGTWYFLARSRIRPPPRFRVGEYGAVLWLYSAFCLYLLLQILPVGTVLGLDYELPDGTRLPMHTLSLAPGETALMLLRWLGFGLLFLLMLEVAANPDRARRLLAILFYIIAAYGAFGLVQFTQLGDTLVGLPKWAYHGSATGPFVNRNSFATFLAFGLVLGIALTLSRLDARKERSWSGIAAGLMPLLAGLVVVVPALLASNSRMGAFAAAVGALVVLVLGLAKLRAGSVSVAVVFATGFAAAALFGFAYGETLLERVIALDGDADMRGTLYGQVWQMVLARPLAGHGGGSFEWAFPPYHQLPLHPDFLWNRAHSTYLALWAEMGLLIGSLPLALLAFIAVRAASVFRASRENWAPPLAGLGVLAVAALHSAVDFSLEILANAWFFLAFLAIAVASGRKGRETP